jgi:hypothetical protein
MTGAKRELDALSLSSPSPPTGPQATCRSFRADIVGGLGLGLPPERSYIKYLRLVALSSISFAPTPRTVVSALFFRTLSRNSPHLLLTTPVLWEDIIDGGATKEQTEYIAETARYKYKSLIYESD